MVDQNMDHLFKNNAVSTLAVAVTTTSQTSITLSAGTGGDFPSPAGDGTDYFFITVVKTSGTREIMCIVARSSDVLTVGIPGSGAANSSGRGYDNSTATTFSVDDVVELRVTAKILENLRDRPGTHVWTGSQRATMQTLSDAATIAWDMDSGNDAKVTLGGNRALGQPTNQTVGQGGYLYVVQDGTGSRTLSYHADFKFLSGTAPTIDGTAAAINVFHYHVYATNSIMLTYLGVYS